MDQPLVGSMVDLDAVDALIGWEAIGRFLEFLRIDHRVD